MARAHLGGPLGNSPRDQRDEFVGENVLYEGGPPPKKARGPKKVSSNTFHSKVTGETSKGRPDRAGHFRRGGFVRGRFNGGGDVGDVDEDHERVTASYPYEPPGGAASYPDAPPEKRPERLPSPVEPSSPSVPMPRSRPASAPSIPKPRPVVRPARPAARPASYPTGGPSSSRFGSDGYNKGGGVKKK
jgi:hypothetical protein